MMLDYDVKKEMLDSEKITRKRSVGFIKKLLLFLKYDLYYPSFKKIVYAEEKPNTKLMVTCQKTTNLIQVNM